MPSRNRFFKKTYTKGHFYDFSKYGEEKEDP